MTKRCPGCGIVLQSENEDALGYVPSNTNNKATLCQRCFKVKNYNEALLIETPKLAYKLIDKINNTGNFVFFLIDFLNINEETIGIFKQIKINKCLVISKSDIIPRNVFFKNVENWLRNDFEISDEIIFVSALKNYNINGIAKKMDKYLVDVAYIVGYTNSGKSSLIDAVYRKHNGKVSNLTISYLPNMTTDFININIGDDLTLVDTPGLSLKDSIYETADLDFIDKIECKNFIKPIIYQMKESESIVLEKQFRFEYLGTEKNSFIFYFSDKIELDKVFPNSNLLREEDNLIFEVMGDSDIVIKGLGFINVKESCQIKIYSKYLNLIEIRESMFK